MVCVDSGREAMCIKTSKDVEKVITNGWTWEGD